MKHSDAEGGGEASAEAGTEASQTRQHHQTQGHQRQQELAPPQVCEYTHAGTEMFESVGITVTELFIHLASYAWQRKQPWLGAMYYSTSHTGDN